METTATISGSLESNPKDMIIPTKSSEVIIIGAGPAGLSCARELAKAGREVMVIEKNNTIGKKVCAGGITASGLLLHLPAAIIEQEFPCQHIYSRYQKVEIKHDKPVIATINRVTLGQQMAEEARLAGAVINKNTLVKEIKRCSIIIRQNNEEQEIRFRHLVGADGSRSLVRRHLKVGNRKTGLGLNCQLNLTGNKMEWHLKPHLFGPGYAWLFPHKKTISIGAYHPFCGKRASHLLDRLRLWADSQGYSLEAKQIEGGLINYDYQGFHFNNIYLAGDAAGLASGLTGEGIFPAIISGMAVARKIIDPNYPAKEVNDITKKQRLHNRITRLNSKNKTICSLGAEAIIVMLKTKLIDFRILEMAK